MSTTPSLHGNAFPWFFPLFQNYNIYNSNQLQFFFKNEGKQIDLWARTLSPSEKLHSYWPGNSSMLLNQKKSEEKNQDAKNKII